MRAIFLAFIVVALPLIITAHEGCRFREFLEFKYSYNKVYANATDEYLRCMVFTENFEMIEKHNRLYKAKKSSYMQALNEFGDISKEEFLKAYTGIPPQPQIQPEPQPNHSHSHERHGRVKRATSTWTVPNTFVPTTLNLTTSSIPIRNQAACGSCWAFSAAGVLEYYYLKKYNTVVNLSEQNFVDCVRGSSSGCNGGMPYDAIAYNRLNGVDYESIYPYRAVTGTCAYKTTTISTNGVPSSVAPQYYTFQTSELALAYAVYNFGWVSVAINADSLQFYKSGVLPSAGCPLKPNHGVIVVGYGTLNGVPYWIIRNSWGTGWGEAGYMKLQRNKNACDIINPYSLFRVYVAP